MTAAPGPLPGRSVAWDGLMQPSARQLVRAATQEVHERLHRHAGFAAIQDATIDLPAYRALLLRLYGFYVPFEAAADLGLERSRWLEGDLGAMHLDSGTFATIPRCPHVFRLDTPERRLGAAYVVEGSTLGGRALGRSLDRLLGPNGTEGRSFFLGRGSGTGAAWTGFLARLEAATREPGPRADVVAAAVETFTAFEEWLSGWRTAAHG